jgi:DNA helicase-2/ATP-dependent DNA helicase PcrA
MYRTDGDEERLENIAELKQSIKEFENQNTESEFSSLESYLQEVALYTNADYKDDGETVKLMTIHQAKGLEFPYVFIIGLSEGIFPNYRSIREGKKAAEEEERRLMYVAVTRAENGLFLTESEGYNFMTRQEKFPSRYILEVSEGLLHLDGEIDKELMNNLLAGTKRQMEELLFETNPLLFNVGDKVSHKIFGEGEIIGKQNESSYRVRFEKGERFIQSNFLKKIKSVATEEKKLKVGFEINDVKLGKGRIIEVFDVPGNESAIVEFESGNKRWVEEKQGEIIVLPDMYEIPEPEETEPQRPAPAEGLQVGSVINHQRFGRGVVTSIFGEGEQAKMMVDFDKEGTKQLLIKFTKFEFE